MSATPDPAEAVAVVEYDPAWPLLFEAESKNVRDAFGENAVAVEHIGSTAVTGLAAKPVIDLLVGLRTLELVPGRIRAMERLGYEYLGENGIPGRLFFHKGRPRSHHVHAVLFGSNHWERHLAFRDFLRAHAGEAEAYAEFKQSLADEVDADRDGYTAGKEAFAVALEERALAWKRGRVA